jgi:hypothetical protein
MKLNILFFFLFYTSLLSSQQLFDLLSENDEGKHRCRHQTDFLSEQGKSVINPNPLMNNYDVKFDQLDIEAYDTTNQFSGKAVIMAKVMAESIDTFSIELSTKLTVDSVFIDNQKISNWEHQPHNIFVELPSAYLQDDLITFQVYYHTPESYTSSYFSATQHPSYGSFPVSQTLSEPYFAHEFMPCKQQLDDKADSVFIFVTTDSSLRVAGPGLLTEVDLSEGKKRYEWRTHIPTAYYLIFFAVSDYQDYTIYAKPDSLPEDSVMIQNYIFDYPDCLEANKANIDNTVNMIELLSNLYGLYPFHQEKYGHYFWYPSSFSGMEHITMSGMRYFNTYLISHELGHSWFGDNVTCATWSDIWVNEGFATYTQYLVLEYLYSKASADAQLNSYMNYVMGQPGGSVYVPPDDLNSVGRIFSTRLSYRKGGILVHMIRFEMDNDSLFFRTLYEFQQQYADSIATGLDFKQVCEDVSGLDFTDFFNQWYFGEGYPIFSVNWSQQEDTILVNLTQSTSTTVTPLFKTSVELGFEWATGDTVIRVRQEQNDTTYKFIIPFEITEISVDPNNWLLNQVDTIIHKKNVDLKVYIQGPFDVETGLMATFLNPGDLPLNQPYNEPPWNYSGNEILTSIPENMVDWVLVEIRDTTTADLAIPESVISRQAALLMSNGKVNKIDGEAPLQFSQNLNNNLFIVLSHRNHLPVISANPLEYDKGTYHYDFSPGFDQVLGGELGYTQLDDGIFGLTAGDANADKSVDDLDKTEVWQMESGKRGYLKADLNMDSEIDNNDKNEQWFPMQGKSSQVPQ